MRKETISFVMRGGIPTKTVRHIFMLIKSGKI